MAGQNLNTVSIYQFTDLIKRDFSVHNDNFVETGKAAKLFIYDDVADHTGDRKRYSEIDTETFASVKPEGDDAAKAHVQYGYEKDCIMRRFAREIDITWEMRRLNKKPEVMTKLQSLNHFVPNRLELDLTHRFTFGTATSYTDVDGYTVDTTVGDTLALISSVHTLRASSSTYSNVITGNPTFSKGGLEIAESIANTNILSNFGERRVMQFNWIVSGDDPTTVNDIKQFLNSTADVDQNNPSVTNVYYKKYMHLVLPYMATTASGAYDSTKAKYWGIVAAGQGQSGWQAYLSVWEAPNLRTPATGNNGEDFHNDNWSYGCRGAYGICAVTGRGVIWSTGAGS